MEVIVGQRLGKKFENTTGGNQKESIHRLSTANTKAKGKQKIKNKQR